MSPEDLRRLVTLTPTRDYQLMLAWKTRKKYNTHKNCKCMLCSDR